MFREEGRITESARNVIFHLLLLYSTTVTCTGTASSKPLPQRTPIHGDRRDYEDRSRRRSRAQREWSGAPFLPPSGGPSPLTGRTPLQQFLRGVQLLIRLPDYCIFRTSTLRPSRSVRKGPLRTIFSRTNMS